MAVCLIIYFVWVKKIKTPTVVTEILLVKYNKKLKKIKQITAKNNIVFEVEKYFSKIANQELNFDNIEENIKTIKKIKNNYEVFKDLKNIKNKNEYSQKLKNLEKNCLLYEFKDEIKLLDDNNKYFEIFCFNKSKLNFELQRYFGSQDFFVFENKYFLLNSNKIYLIDGNNIFNSDVDQYNINIKKCAKTIDNKLVYKIIIKINNILIEKEVVVPQKKLQKLLNKNIFTNTNN